MTKAPRKKPAVPLLASAPKTTDRVLTTFPQALAEAEKAKLLAARRQEILATAEARILKLKERMDAVANKAAADASRLEKRMSVHGRRVRQYAHDHREELTSERRAASIELPSEDVLRWDTRSFVHIPKPAAFVAEALRRRQAGNLLVSTWKPSKEKCREHPDVMRRMKNGRIVNQDRFIFEFSGVRDRLELIVDTDTGEESFEITTPKQKKESDEDDVR